jgi:hypothetical protein
MNEAVLRNLVQRARTLDPPEDRFEEEVRPTIEMPVSAILQEYNPNEVGHILRIWKELFGIKLDPNKVSEHLQSLGRWQGIKAW